MKPRLLFFCARSPLPAIDGTRERLLAAIKALAPHWQIDLLLISRDRISRETAAELKELIGGSLKIFDLPAWRGAIKAGVGLLQNRPLQSAYFYLPAVQKYLDSVSGEYRAFYCHTLRLAPYFLKAKNPRLIKRTFLDFNDAISLHYEEAAGRTRGFWNMIHRWEKERLEDYETVLLDSFSHYSLLTARDRDWMIRNWQKRHPDRPAPPIKVIRYGLDDGLLDYRYHPETKNLVFIGNLSYLPNRQGLEDFCRLVWPLVRKADPERELIVIGNEGEKYFGGQRGIKALGFVPDPYGLMIKQAAFLNPITFGAGISTKTVLALGLGLPVISTPVGLAGLEGHENLENILTIDYRRPEETAGKIISFLSNMDARRAASQKEKELVSSSYLRSRNDGELVGSLEELAAEHQ